MKIQTCRKRNVYLEVFPVFKIDISGRTLFRRKVLKEHLWSVFIQAHEILGICMIFFSHMFELQIDILGQYKYFVPSIVVRVIYQLYQVPEFLEYLTIIFNNPIYLDRWPLHTSNRELNKTISYCAKQLKVNSIQLQK